jgi:hypothetical protein
VSSHTHAISKMANLQSSPVSHVQARVTREQGLGGGWGVNGISVSRCRGGTSEHAKS